MYIHDESNEYEHNPVHEVIEDETIAILLRGKDETIAVLLRGNLPLILLYEQ